MGERVVDTGSGNALRSKNLHESSSLSHLLKQRVSSHKLNSLPAMDSLVLDGGETTDVKVALTSKNSKDASG